MLIDKLIKLKKVIESNSSVIITAIIGVATVFISWKANSIYELQTIIAKSSELPNFQIRMERKFEDDNDSYYYIIRILNLGGKYYNFEAEVITFLDCSLYCNLDVYDVLVPIGYYYTDWNAYKYYEEDSNVIQVFDNMHKRVIIDNLRDEISSYNQKNLENDLFCFTNTYIKISYINLLGEEETEYYFIDFIDNLWHIGDKEGEYVFNVYEDCRSHNHIIEIIEDEKISVQQLIDNIFKIYKDDVAVLSFGEEEEDMERILFGIVIGVGVVGVLELFKDGVKKEIRIKYYATLVYYDLKNIENYLKEEQGNVNLLYTDNWKNTLAECTLLKPNDIAYLYDLYNIVYNYNDAYKQRIQNVHLIQKKDISYFDELRRKIFLVNENFIDTSRYKVEYEKILNKLEKKISIQKS